MEKLQNIHAEPLGTIEQNNTNQDGHDTDQAACEYLKEGNGSLPHEGKTEAFNERYHRIE
jgi:hypothetical protein